MMTQQIKKVKKLKRMKKIKNAQDINKQGFSLVELVIAMGILGIFMPVVVGMMNSAITTRESAETITGNVMNSSAIVQLFNRDFEQATAMTIVDENHVKMRTQDGTCIDWKIKDNALLTAKSNTAIAEDDTTTWTTIYDKVNTPKDLGETGETFVQNDNTLVYDIILGDDKSTNTVAGEITPIVTSTSPGQCWS